jgi:hypothetical protein
MTTIGTDHRNNICHYVVALVLRQRATCNRCALTVAQDEKHYLDNGASDEYRHDDQIDVWINQKTNTIGCIF